MTITKLEWSRTIVMKAWELEPDYSLVYVTEPAHDRGSVTLNVSAGSAKKGLTISFVKKGD
jgi:hypothetical protein